jgi:hypothetical protein
MVAPATAVGREATVDRPTGQPKVRAAAIPLLGVGAGLVVRAAAAVATRLGASVVAGMVGRQAPTIGKGANGQRHKGRAYSRQQKGSRRL